MKTPVKVKAESNDVYLFLFYAANTQPLKGNYAIFKKKKKTTTKCHVEVPQLRMLCLHFLTEQINNKLPVPNG